MKKVIINILVLLVSMFALVGCNEEKTEGSTSTEGNTPTSVTETVTETAEKIYGDTIYNELTTATAAEAKACFDFFWETANKKEGKAFGLIPDRYPNNGLSSIASVGYGLTAIPIGVLNGWITYEEGYKRVVDTLTSMKPSLPATS